MRSSLMPPPTCCTYTLRVHLNRSSLGIDHAFRLFSKNSEPTIEAAESPLYPPYDVGAYAADVTRYDASGELTVQFVQQIETEDGGQPVDSPPATLQILGQGEDYSLLLPSNPLSLLTPSGDIGMLISPFFYADTRRTFYVEPTLTETTSERWQGYVIGVPGLVGKPDRWWEHIPVEAYVPRSPKDPDPGDPVYDHSIFEMGERSDWATSPAVAVMFGERLIGHEGAIDAHASSASVTKGAGPLTAIGGAGLTAGALRGLRTQIFITG